MVVTKLKAAVLMIAMMTSKWVGRMARKMAVMRETLIWTEMTVA